MLKEILKNKEILDIITEIYSEIDNEKELMDKWKSFIDFLYHAKFIDKRDRNFYYSYEYEDIISTLEMAASNKINLDEKNKENISNNLILLIKNQIQKNFSVNTVVKRYNKNIMEIKDFLENKKFSTLDNIKNENYERKKINNFLKKTALIINPEILDKEEIIIEFSKLKNINDIQLYENIQELQENNIIKFFPPNERKYGILFLLKFFPEWTKNNFTYTELENLFKDKELQKYIKMLDVNLKKISYKELKKDTLEEFLNIQFTQENYILFIEQYLKEKFPEVSIPSFYEILQEFKQNNMINTKLEEN